MKPSWYRAAVIATVGLAFAGSALCEEDAEVTAFTKNLVAAINSKNPDRSKALLHPGSLSCASSGQDMLLSDIFARQARNAIPPDYRWKVIPIPDGERPLFADKFDYPVRPTHLLTIDFDTGPHRSTSLVLQIARAGSGWREVTACPKPETVAAAKQAAQTRKQEQARAQQLALAMPPKVKAEVLRALAEGRRIDAIKAYRAATGEDLSMSKSVVELVEAGQVK